MCIRDRKIGLTFNNHIDNLTYKTSFIFVPLLRYNDLYNNMSQILRNIGLNLKIPKHCVSFELTTYRNIPTPIKDWNKYVLNEDRITVTLSNPYVRNYQLATEKGEKIMTMNKISKIYNEIDYDGITEPLMIYLVDGSNTKLRLVDVIDNPIRHYNNVVTRMVKKYAY